MWSTDVARIYGWGKARFEVLRHRWLAELVEMKSLATPARRLRTLVSGGAGNLDSSDLCTWADNDLPLRLTPVCY